MELEEANKIMQCFNETYDEVRKERQKWDTKRMHDKNAHYAYSALCFSINKLDEMHDKLEKLLIEV